MLAIGYLSAHDPQWNVTTVQLASHFSISKAKTKFEDPHLIVDDLKRGRDQQFKNHLEHELLILIIIIVTIIIIIFIENKITRYNFQNNKIQMAWLTSWLVVR